jgi:hypothetical protein
MRRIARPLIELAGIGCLAAIVSTASVDRALAQAKQAPATQAAPAAQPPQIKQIALTEKQIEQVLAAQKDLEAIYDKMPDDSNAKPDPKIDAQLEDVAKKYGFASYADYNDVVDNVGLVLGGVDPATKKYVGTDAMIKKQIEAVQADKKMPAKDKKEVLADLDAALKTPGPQIENKGNIELVEKYYDKLAEALSEDE